MFSDVSLLLNIVGVRETKILNSYMLVPIMKGSFVSSDRIVYILLIKFIERLTRYFVFFFRLDVNICSFEETFYMSLNSAL